METIVLYPLPAMGHLISMVELGKLILNNHPSHSISIHILISTPSIHLGSTAPYIASVSAATPSITFHHLPAPTPPLDPISFPSFELFLFEHVNRTNPHVHNALLSISQSSPIQAFIIDLFCSTALKIATSLHIPTYYFFTSGISCLSLFIYIPSLHKSTTKSFKDLNHTLLHVPGLPPFPASHMPDPTLDRTKETYSRFLNIATHLPKSAGIIVNSFDSLEPRALETISNGLCVPDGPTPPIFCIGPLIASNERRGDEAEQCLKWLDKQSSRSVVFLCFGSMGLFSKEQLKEIAVGLERRGLVSAAEVEKRVRELMDSEEGNSIRERVKAKKEEAIVATNEGGSSRIALAKLVQSWKQG
ncbi:udp-glycosyltransferase 88b1 [Quercus suber]|uniref:Udp-glycosyltransferase 88b1 n=1 Tax=Quercus suber TaxID=58331 RepID=A0AAW0L906_QUESU